MVTPAPIFPSTPLEQACQALVAATHAHRYAVHAIMEKADAIAFLSMGKGLPAYVTTAQAERLSSLTADIENCRADLRAAGEADAALALKKAA